MFTKKYIFRKIFIFLLIGMFSFSSVITQGKKISYEATNDVIESVYDNITNIQKQLESIVQSYFINTVDNSVGKPNTKSLSIYTSQLKTLQSKLSDFITKDLDPIQRAELETLNNATNSLIYMSEKIDKLLNSSDAKEQYILLRAIIYIETLINQTLSYFTRGV